MPSNRIVLVAKIAASLVLLLIIILAADWNQVGQSLRNSQVELLGIVFLLLTVCVVVSAFKWWLLLRIHKVQYSFSDLNRWYFIAMFFNNFLPTSIGGDGFRIFRTYRNPRGRSTAFVAVLVERVSGILALLGLAWFAAIYSYVTSGNSLSGLYAAAGAAGIAVTLLTSGVVYYLHRRGISLTFSKLPNAVQLFLEHFYDYKSDVGNTLNIVWVSIGFHILSLCWMYILTRAIGAEITLYELAIVSALVGVITIIPLSINGVGLVDGAFIYLVAQFDVSYAHGLTFMILQRLLVLPVSVIGMVLYFIDRKGNGVIPNSPVNGSSPVLSDS